MNWYKKMKLAYLEEDWRTHLSTYMNSMLIMAKKHMNSEKDDTEILKEAFERWIKRAEQGSEGIDEQTMLEIHAFVFDKFGFDPLSGAIKGETGNNLQEYEVDFDEEDPTAPMTWDIRTPTAQELDQQWGGEPEPNAPSAQELEEWPVLKEEPKRNKPL